MKEDVLAYLESEVRFREREARMRGIADLLIAKYNIDIDRRKLADIISDANTMDRCWRKILEERPDLRGTDYKEKDKLEQEYILNLGYTPGYDTDVKQLSML